MRQTHDIASMRSSFFPGVRAREGSADEAGAASGIDGLGEEAFAEMARADLRCLAEECTVLPEAGFLTQQQEELQDELETALARFRAIREEWRAAIRATAAAGPGWEVRRLLVCGLVAAVLLLCVRLAGWAVPWEFPALLAVLAVLVGMGPLRITGRLKGGALGAIEFAVLLGAGVLAVRASRRLARLRGKSRKWDLAAEALSRGQQIGFDSLMGRFRYQYQRGAAVSRLTNGG